MSKNGTDAAHYNLDAHQPMSTTCSTDVAENASYQLMAVYIPSSPV